MDGTEFLNLPFLSKFPHTYHIRSSNRVVTVLTAEITRALYVVSSRVNEKIYHLFPIDGKGK